MPVTVYILTTKGPVRIQQITEEAPSIQSVMCLDGRAHALPISSRYDAFVRNPTGVIERATGHGAYRMDVDRTIDDGDSWQLGVCLAHFSQQTTGEDWHVFATGEVDRGLVIRPVSHVPDKLVQATTLIRALSAAGKRVRVFVPQHDDEQLEGIEDIEIDQVTHVDQVLDHLGIAPPKPEVSSPRAQDTPIDEMRNSQRGLMWGLPVLLILGWLLWTPFNWMGLASDGKLLELEEAMSEGGSTFVGKYQQSLFLLIQEFRSPDPGAPELIGIVVTATSSGDCATKSDTQTHSWNDLIPKSDSICELVVHADDPHRDGVITGRLGYWPDGLATGTTPERTMRGSASATGHKWSLKFQRLPTQGAIVRLVILKGLAVPSGSQPWYSSLLREPRSSADFMSAKARVERLGYHVFVHDWQCP